jgi:hypothetical protein
MFPFNLENRSGYVFITTIGGADWLASSRHENFLKSANGPDQSSAKVYFNCTY